MADCRMGRERGRSLDTVAAGAAGQQRYIPANLKPAGRTYSTAVTPCSTRV
jgi:hypothetical protein